MNWKSEWNYLPPIGPVFSLWLIALVLLGGMLYNRAVNIQRYLEPVLGIFQPRSDFTKSINTVFEEELGTEPIKGLSIKSSSIFLEKSLLFSREGRLNDQAQDVVKKLARILIRLLNDSEMRSDISHVHVSARFHYRPGEADIFERMKVQWMAALVQDSLFRAEPELGKRYNHYFEISAHPAHPKRENSELVELRVVPSELLYTEVLQRLAKYAR